MDDAANQQAPATLRIGIWDFHPETCRLTSNGKEVRLSPKSADVLNYLAERAGELVTQDELLERFWRGTFVSPNAVHKCIGELRNAFGNGTNGPGYIETIPKRGYRLVAPAGWVAAANDQPIEPEADAGETCVLPLTAGHTDATNGVGRTPPSLSHRTKLSIAGLGAILGSVAIVAFWMQTTSTIIEAPVVKIGKRTAVLLSPAANGKPENDLELVRQILDRITSGFGSSKDATVEMRRIELSSVQQGNEAVGWNADYGVHVEVAKRADGLHASILLQPNDPKRLSHREDMVYPANSPAAFIDAVSTEVRDDLGTILDDRSVDEMASWGTNNLHAYHLAKKADTFQRIQTVESLLHAEAIFKQAIDIDAGFDYAYLSLSNVYFLIAQSPTNTEIRERIRRSAQSLLRDVRTASGNQQTIDFIERVYRMLSAGNAFDSEELIRAELQRHPDDILSLRLYARLLLGANLLSEGVAYVDRAILLAQKTADSEVAAALESEYATSLLLMGHSEAAVRQMKRNVEDYPDFTVSLHGLAKELTRMGRGQEANFYLARLKNSDEVWGAYTEMLMVAINGKAKLGTARMESMFKNPLITNSGRGDVCFILGDVDCGVRFWHELEPAFLPLFWQYLPTMELYYPQEVVLDARYQAMLEQLGIGKTWRAYMRERASELSQVTGIEVSKDVSTEDTALD